MNIRWYSFVYCEFLLVRKVHAISSQWWSFYATLFVSTSQYKSRPWCNINKLADCCHGVYRSHQGLYLEQHLCVSFACPNSMNLNSPFIWTTIKFQITCCAIVSGNPFSKFIKGISCWVAVLGTYQEIFFCKKWTKFRESTSTLIRLKSEYKCAWVL